MKSKRSRKDRARRTKPSEKTLIQDFVEYWTLKDSNFKQRTKNVYQLILDEFKRQNGL